MRAHTVIVGGGVMGASIALHLAPRRDPIADPVVLLERRDLAAGSSGRSGAILRQHYGESELAAMARDSLRFFSTFEARTGRDIGFRQVGVLTLAGPRAPEWIERLERNVAMQRSIGIDTRRVEAAEIRRLAPGTAVLEGTVGAWEPGGGFVDPHRTVEAFAALARFHGATARTATPVTGLRIEDGRVLGVETPHEPIEARQVVVAAGPWTRRLLAQARVELPLWTVRPEQHFLEMPPPPPGYSTPEPAREVPLEGLHAEVEARFATRDQEPPPVAHPVVLDLELGFYARCEPETGRTRVGRLDHDGDAELEDPDQLDEEVSEGYRRWARERLALRLPVYARQPDAGSQAAWYTLSPDSQAILGPCPGVEGLFVASGFSGHGFKLAPSIGEGMAQLLLGEPVSAFDEDFFSPRRFERTRKRRPGPFGL